MIELHVSPNAQFGGDGSASAPFADIISARNAIRTMRAEGNIGDTITVLLHEGVHYLSETFELTEADSGSEEFPIVYRSAPGERAIMSGGEIVKGWEECENGIWRAHIEGADRCRTFRVGDSEAILARYPSYDPDEPRTGGWLFADWWGKPWERGSLFYPLSGLKHRGDNLEWDVEIPTAGEYTVWAAYARPGDDDVTLRVTVTSGKTTSDGISIALERTKPPEHFRAKIGRVVVSNGDATIRLVNDTGGDFEISYLLFVSDPDWDPNEGLVITTHWGEYRIDGLAEDAALFFAYVEAYSRKEGADIVEPRSEPPGKYDRIVTRPGDLPKWQRWDLVDINAFPAWGWASWITSVTAADQETSTIWTECRQDFRPGNRYFLAGTPEAMSDPGEFYHDPHAQAIGYLPRKPDELTKRNAVVARLKTLLRISGARIFFEDITFSDTDYTAPGGYPIPEDAAIIFTGARTCTVTRCKFKHIMGYAVRLENRSAEIRIAENEMKDLGGGGVILVGDDDTKPTDNEILANEIANCGKIYKHVSGVSVIPGDNNRVAYNSIAGMPRYAISASSGKGWSSHRNIIEYNDIRDTNLETNDTGAIVTLGRDKIPSGNVIRFNRLLNTVGLKTTQYGEFMSPHYTWGIYLDDFSSGTIIYGNIVDGTVLGGVHLHGGKDNIIENNIFLNGSERQICFSPIFSDPSSSFMQNNRFNRNIIAAGASDHFIFTLPGRWYRSILSECDYNLYWRTEGSNFEEEEASTPEGSLAAWRDAGFDTHGICADPKLVVDEEGFVVPGPDSPVWNLGFERIPVELIGLRGYKREKANS